MTENPDDGIFCTSCSPECRSVGYYLTFAVGLILFGVGIILIIMLVQDTGLGLLIGGSFIVLCSPLWNRSPKACVASLKNPLRISSLLIYLGCLAFTLVAVLLEFDDILTILAGVLLAMSGVWYFLSYFDNGQQAIIQCCKTCCGKGEGQQSSS